MHLVLKVPGLRKKPPLDPAPAGTPPGTLVFDPESPPPKVHLIAYGPDEFVEQDIQDLHDLEEFLGRWPVLWINVDGIGDAHTLEALGKIFRIHPLVLEDVLNIRHRPKLEEFENQVFLMTRMAFFEQRFSHEQLSILLGSDYVVTFQEREGDCLNAIRDRLRTRRGLVRDAGADYLAYAILDSVIDGYFPVLEAFGERLEDLEQEILERPTTLTIARVQHARRDLLGLRRSIWPQREFLSTLVRDPIPLVTDRTRMYLRDAYDHAVRIMDLVDTYRDLSAGLSDLYMSSVSNRMNDVMKVLTVIATIFIPLTFVAGIYGMNFDTQASPWNMPELEWYWGYPVALGFMAAVAIGLIVFFSRRNWIGSPPLRGEEAVGPADG